MKLNSLVVCLIVLAFTGWEVIADEPAATGPSDQSSTTRPTMEELLPRLMIWSEKWDATLKGVVDESTAKAAIEPLRKEIKEIEPILREMPEVPEDQQQAFIASHPDFVKLSSAVNHDYNRIKNDPKLWPILQDVLNHSRSESSETTQPDN